MLTVEINREEHRVEIYLDNEGLRTLQKSIEYRRKHGGHEHLMTPSWAGNELSEMAQGKVTEIVNHLLIVFRKKED